MRTPQKSWANSRPFGPIRASSVGLLFAFAALCMTGACAPEKTDPPPDRDLQREGRDLFGAPPTDPATQRTKDGKTATPTAGAWTIVIAAHRGQTQDALARQTLERVRSFGQLPEAYLERRGEATVLAFGRYTGPGDPRAQADLERIKSIQIDGQRPFAGAVLAPPEDIIGGTIPEYDLRNAKTLHGGWALYTLQVGVYSREGGKPPTPQELAEFRKAAEQAAAQLRREGQQAFYYHGPHRSMVTIGLFGKDDYSIDPDDSTVTESFALQRLKREFPYNLLNGRGIRQRVKGRPENDPNAYEMQPSFLVAVPGN